ncbi:LysR family transcriptional regulator [Acinetobacter sp. ANC 4639]
MLPVDSFQGVLTFIVAARSHSFTEAAEKLGISKSAVGKSISKLEERLGAQLFHRTTRKISLTADGEAYLTACSSALDEIGMAESALGSKSGEPAGRLRIDMPVAFGRRKLVPLLFNMVNKYPNLHLNITFSDDLIDPIEEGVDLLIRYGDIPDSTGLVARPLVSQRWAICAAPHYLEKFGTPLTPEDISKHQCITIGHRRGQPLAWRLKINGETVRILPPATHQIGDGEASIQAAIAGIGLCQMPRCLFQEDLDVGRLVEVLAPYEPDTVQVHMVWPKVSHLRPKVRFVVDELIKSSHEWR